LILKRRIGIMRQAQLMRYFLSLGSNLGDRQMNLRRARSLLEAEGMKIRRCSSVYETEPVDLPSSAAGAWFYNQAVEVDIDLNPAELLPLVKKIEINMGRQPSLSREPRVIDIDILLAEDSVIQTEDLMIPHPRLEKRNFVLIPLREISPLTCHPVLKMTIEELSDKSPDQSVVRKIES